jgi:DNA-binding XRE family transcriptional regulator
MAADTPKPPINVDYFEDLTGDIQPVQEDHLRPDRRPHQRPARRKGLTLAELSQLTGVEEKKLLEIEANRLCPQLGMMIKLSKALDSALRSGAFR